MSNTPMGFPNLGQPAQPAAETPKKSKRKDRATAKPVNESQRRVRGLIAILAALIAGALVLTTLSENKSKGSVFVLRAASTILPLTPIEASQLEAVQLPIEAVEAGALRADTADAVLAAAKKGSTAVVGRYALYPILASQQIRLKSMLTIDAQLATPLGPQERLVTVNVPLDRGVAGLVRTGDRVDVYSVRDAGDSVLLAENVEVVLAAPATDVVKSSGEKNPESDPLTRLPDYPVPAMYVVRVPASLVSALVDADSSTKLYLAYRNNASAPATLCAPSDTSCSTPSTTLPPSGSTTTLP
jgi:Flp pilus assembly protein CpaB